jgi:hypothetical protein
MGARERPFSCEPYATGIGDIATSVPNPAKRKEPRQFRSVEARVMLVRAFWRPREGAPAASVSRARWHTRGRAAWRGGDPFIAHIFLVRRTHRIHTAMLWMKACIVASLRNVWQKPTSRLPMDGSKLPSNARLSLCSNAVGVRWLMRNTCSPGFSYCKPLAGKAGTDFSKSSPRIQSEIRANIGRVLSLQIDRNAAIGHWRLPHQRQPQLVTVGVHRPRRIRCAAFLPDA